MEEGEQSTASQDEQSTSQVKRPMNAFMLWSKEKRRKISSVDPSLHNSHISKILGEEWKMLPLHEKDPYIKKSKTLMEKHKQEHPDYHYKPRQNKLTKALKELSSLHSSLTTPAGFTARIKSLSMSKYVPNADRHAPYYGHDRSQVLHTRESEYDDIPYRTLPPIYSRPIPCSGCTCARDCRESLGYPTPHLFRYSSRPECRDARSYHQDRPAMLQTTWKAHPVQSPRYGWSVPILVNEPRVESNRVMAKEYEEDSQKSSDDEDSKVELEKVNKVQS